MTPEELKEMANSGQLKPDDLIWKQGMKDWIEAAVGKATPDALGHYEFANGISVPDTENEKET